jgi:hypothetical protein
MKSKLFFVCGPAYLLAAVALWAMPATACAQEIFVATESSGRTAGEVGVYSLSGTPINASLITGLNEPTSLLVSGNNLYVTNFGNGTVGEYNATTGAPINATLISGLPHTVNDGPFGLALYNGNLFVSTEYGFRISEYNATTGAAINPNFVLAGEPTAMAVANGDLFVTNPDVYAISEYNATTGATINPDLFTTSVHTDIAGIIASGNDLFIGDYYNGAVEYSTSGALVNSSFISGAKAVSSLATSSGNFFLTTDYEYTGYVSEYSSAGTLLNSSLIPNLDFPSDIVIATVPEPASWVPLAIAALALLACGLRQRYLLVAR